MAEISVADAEQRGDDDGQRADGLVLPSEICFSALLDGVGDLLHLRRAAAARQYPTGEEYGEDQCERARADDDGQQ
jgi:hypothetical protein